MLKLGILGAGNIAGVMAATVARMDDVCNYAIASRDPQKAAAFAQKWDMPKAYGSYEELVSDPDVELIYIATPHSHHYAHVRLCLEHGKHVLCEKALTVNAQQANALFELAKEKHLLLSEAIWPRYLPMRQIIEDVINSRIVGRPWMLTANLGYLISSVPRMQEPSLAGGALLDLGVYSLNFAAMFLGSDPISISGSAVLTDKGVDAQDSITLQYADGRMAVLTASMNGLSDRRGILYCSNGFLEVTNINKPEKLDVYDAGRNLIASYDEPPCISGYEYEVEACVRAIEEGRLECPQMPHAESLRIMRWMDSLRQQSGVRYPEEIERL